MPVYNGSQKVAFPGIDKIYVGNDLVYRRVIPDTQLYFIESTSNAVGSFCIQTNIGLARTDKLEIKYQLTNATYNQSTGQYNGSLVTSSNLDTKIGHADNVNNKFVAYWNGSSKQVDFSTYFDTNVHTLYTKRTSALSTSVSAAIDNSDYGTISATSASAISRLAFFGGWDLNQNSIIARIYDITITNSSGTLLHHLVPYLKNMVPGLLDTETNVFYPNVGSGKLEYAIKPYKQLEYIHFSGNEYVVLNIRAKDIVQHALRVDCLTQARNVYIYRTYKTLSNQDLSNQDVLGILITTTSTNNKQWVEGKFGNKTALITADYGTRYIDMAYNQSNSSTASNGWTHKMINPATGIVLGPESVLISNGQVHNNDVNIAIGANNQDNHIAQYNKYVGNVYSVKRTYNYVNEPTDNDTVNNNYVPAQRKSDNVCGLYDLVHNDFYPMEGTANKDAAAGPAVKDELG